MKCGKCGDPVQPQAVYTYKDKKVCDDCYLDLIIGVPDVDITKLPPEIQCGFHHVMKNWHRDRPNQHHIRFPGPGRGKK